MLVVAKLHSLSILTVALPCFGVQSLSTNADAKSGADENIASQRTINQSSDESKTPPRKDPPSPPRPPRRAFQFSSDAKFNAVRDLGPTGTTLGLNRISNSFSVAEFQRTGILSARLDYENTGFNFGSFSSLAPGVQDPINSGRLFSLQTSYIRPINAKLSYGVAGTFRVVGDANARFGGSQERGIGVFARRQLASNFAMSFGLNVLSQLGDDNLILPIVGIDWKVSPKLQITTGPTVAGANLQIAYQIDTKQSANLQAGFEIRNFRLRDSGPEANHILRERGLPISIGYRYNALPGLVFTANLGITLSQEFTFAGPTGAQISKQRQDAAPFFSIGLQARF